MVVVIIRIVFVEWLTLAYNACIELDAWSCQRRSTEGVASCQFFLEIKSLWEYNHWLESVSLERTKLRSPGPRSTEAKSPLRLAATVLNLPRTEWQPAGNAQPGQRCLRSKVLAEWSRISSNSAHLFSPSRLSYSRGPHPECGEEGLLNRGAEASARSQTWPSMVTERTELTGSGLRFHLPSPGESKQGSGGGYAQKSWAMPERPRRPLPTPSLRRYSRNTAQTNGLPTSQTGKPRYPRPEGGGA